MTDLFSLAPLGLTLPAETLNFGLAFLGIGGLIFLHELGHFLVARWMGMPVETFSLGFGPRLLGFKWRETDVRLSALPLGGYVKLEGFNPEEPGAEDPHGFLQQPYWKRMLFYSGGILANLAVAFTLFWVVGVDAARWSAPYRLTKVLPNSAAAAAGLEPGDVLRSLDRLNFPGNRWDEAVDYIQARPGQLLHLEYERKGERRTLNIAPTLNGRIGQIGIISEPILEGLTKRAIAPKDLVVGASIAAGRIEEFSGLVFRFLGKLVAFKASRDEVGGPLAITQQMSQAASQGWETFLFICAAISLQLAILNALPIPMLDGGHMAVLTAERLRRRDFSLDFKEKLFTGGFLLLASLMAIVIFLDVLKLRK